MYCAEGDGNGSWIERILSAFAGFEGPVRAECIEIAPAALLRPLAEYEAVVGGGW